MVSEFEGLVTRVVLPNSDDDAELTITFQNDVVEFHVNGKLVFSGDWTANFQEVFEVALKKWKEA
jgi:hypothetical protein